MFRICLYGLIAGGALASVAVVPPPASADPNPHSAGHANDRAVCPGPAQDEAGCLVHVATKTSGGGSTPITSPTPVGYGPADFHRAYGIPPTATAPAGTTIAIVVGYDNPNVKADLDVYDTAFGLPAFPSCSASVTTSCLEVVKQSRNITTNTSWIMESSLDVQTAHQICQNCKILLVEGTTNSWSNLMWGVDQAVARGAKVVNNSFAGLESSYSPSFDAHYNHPGVAFVAGSGDWGYDVRYPAASPYVTAVGGTTLNLDASGNRVSETAWAKTGSGCSVYEPKPSYQKDTGCTGRTVADLSADADSNTGAAIYNSFGYGGTAGWFRLGGTSLSAPLISGMFALGGVEPNVQENAFLYGRMQAVPMRDITEGATAACGSYLCQAGPGYDGPTGFGTPIGLAAF